MSRRIVLVCLLASLVLSRSFPLASSALSNVGMLLLRDALTHADVAPGTYPFYHALNSTPTAVHITGILQSAVEQDESNFSARWGLGRAALAIGNARTAYAMLKESAGRASQNDLLYLDTLTAFSYAGHPEDVIKLYESVPPRWRTQEVSDTVALAYLQESRASGVQESNDALKKAITLRPNDLFANYYLWQMAERDRDVKVAEVYGKTLSALPLKEAYPGDGRLFGFAAEVIPSLLEDGLWDREKTLNVVSSLVWQSDSVAATEGILKRLVERYPTEPDWFFYLAESYYRQGQLGQADALYRQVLGIDPTYKKAYLRLGMVAEAEYQAVPSEFQSKLKDAASWYASYYRTAPDDPFVLNRLAEVCGKLESSHLAADSCNQTAQLLHEASNDTPGKGMPSDVLWRAWLAQAAARKPRYVVGQELDNGWYFLGYDVDEDGLIRGEPVDLLLYWTGPSLLNAGSSKDGWYRAGERWVQVLRGVKNLVPNGGFELGMADGVPAGFQADVHGKYPGNKQLVSDVRAGQRTTVLMLDNPDLSINTNLASKYVPINPRMLYLQAGWMKSRGGRGYMGRCWGGLHVERMRPCDAYDDGYVAAGEKPADWQYYAKLARPFRGADRLQVGLLNYRAVGQLYFDDLLLVEVGMPGEQGRCSTAKMLLQRGREPNAIRLSRFMPGAKAFENNGDESIVARSVAETPC